MGISRIIKPNQYQAAAKIIVAWDANDLLNWVKIHPEKNPLRVFTNWSFGYWPECLYFGRRDETLSNVVASLNLAKKWGGKSGQQLLTVPACIEILRARLEIKPIHGTKLILVRLTSDSPDEAAAVTKAVADCYVEHFGRFGCSREYS